MAAYVDSLSFRQGGSPSYLDARDSKLDSPCVSVTGSTSGRGRSIADRPSGSSENVNGGDATSERESENMEVGSSPSHRCSSTESAVSVREKYAVASSRSASYARGMSKKEKSWGAGLKYHLAIENLSYKVFVKENGAKRPTEKVLLNNVSAQAVPGEILVVFGPSGSGKTTFLDAIAGRIQSTSLTGAILVNGKPIDPKFKKISAYVMQNDAMFPVLTVRETLMFSARLRMRNNTHYHEKVERVEHIIRQLGLGKCANTRVGNEVRRGISGGERRRLSIGVELVHQPAVLFLDEPTSGLDSASALQVMEHLSAIVQDYGYTVITTLHQPSYSMLKTIHNTVVLVQGNVIFHGHHSRMINYYHKVGYSMPEHVTVVEYMLETIKKVLCVPHGKELLVDFYKHNNRALVQETTLPAEMEVDKNLSMNEVGNEDYAASFGTQTIVLAERTMLRTARHMDLFYGRCVLMMVGALAIGSVFFDSKVNKIGIEHRMAFICFSVAFLIFTSAQALPSYLSEREVFTREMSRGAYRISAYVLSGAVVILPFLFVHGLLYTLVSYWLVGLHNTVESVSFFGLVIFMVLSVANAFVTFIAGVCPNLMGGQDMVQSALSFFFLFGGFFITRKSIPKYWIWMESISLFKYPYEVLVASEFRSQPDRIWYDDHTSEDVLNHLGLSIVDPWFNITVMFLFLVGYRLFFYLALRLRNNSMRK